MSADPLAHFILLDSHRVGCITCARPKGRRPVAGGDAVGTAVATDCPSASRVCLWGTQGRARRATSAYQGSPAPRPLAALVLRLVLGPQEVVPQVATVQNY